MAHVQSARNVRRRYDHAIGLFVGVRVCLEHPAALLLFIPAALDGGVVVGFWYLCSTQEVFRRSLLRRRSTSGSRLRVKAEHRPSPYRRRRRTCSHPSDSEARTSWAEGPTRGCSSGRGLPSPARARAPLWRREHHP